LILDDTFDILQKKKIQRALGYIHLSQSKGRELRVESSGKKCNSKKMRDQRTKTIQKEDNTSALTLNWPINADVKM
jgi:hypothetical protein